MPTTITLPSKFAEDENGNKFAPITTPNAVRFPDGSNLNDHLGGFQVTPIVALGTPSGDAPHYAIIFDSSTSKFYQYLWDNNQSGYTWQEIATLEKAFAYFNNGHGIFGFLEIDDGVLSQTLIERPEAGWYSDFAGLYAESIGYAGVIMYFDEFGNEYRTVNWNEINRWYNKSDFSGDYNDLSNKPTIPEAQVNSDWNASSGVAEILNKPSSLPANGGNAATVNSHTVNSDVPANAVFTDTTYVFNTAYNASSNKAATMADVSGKEDKMSIIQQTGYPTTLSPVINTLTKVTMQSSLTVTLPIISTDTGKVQSLVLILTTASGYTPSLTITQTGSIIYFPPDFSIESGKTYEINCMWIGNTTWVIASHEIFWGGQ